MAVTALLYGNSQLQLANKEVDWLDDDIRVALVGAGYTPNQDIHDYWNDVIANEITGSGYTANGIALTSKTAVYTGGTNTTTFDAADVSWPSSTITARYAVIYNRTPSTDGTRPLIALVDFGADVSTTGGTFTITWNASGIFTATVA